jgi:hypothetical protein
MAKTKKATPDTPEVKVLKEIKDTILKQWKEANGAMDQTHRLGNNIYNTAIADCISAINTKIFRIENKKK